MLSVIIPNYNHAPYLRQRIEFVLHQNYQEIEVIILDDASKDNSREIIETFRGHPKVKVINYNEVNSGSTFRQWQKGIELSNGEYIWIAESDDFSDPSFLDRPMQAFESEPDLILAYCQSMKVDEGGNLLGQHSWADGLDAFKWRQDYVEQSSLELQKYLSFRNTIVNASAVVFRKPADADILKESMEMKMCGDWLFWRKLLARPGKIAFFSSPLNFFRAHQQTTRAVTTKEKELIRMQEYRRMIVPDALSIADNRYDWMIEDWYRNRKIYYNSIDYFLPNLPTSLIVRFLMITVSKIKKKLRRRAY